MMLPTIFSSINFTSASDYQPKPVFDHARIFELEVGKYSMFGQETLSLVDRLFLNTKLGRSGTFFYIVSYLAYSSSGLR